LRANRLELRNDLEQFYQASSRLIQDGMIMNNDADATDGGGEAHQVMVSTEGKTLHGTNNSKGLTECWPVQRLSEGRDTLGIQEESKIRLRFRDNQVQHCVDTLG
jgi:hypothetical protein